MSKDGVKDIIRTTAVGGAMQEMLTYGIPEIGWDGDPWVTLCWNKLESRWEIWSERGEEPVCCLLYTSPSPRDLSTSRMPSSA